MTEFERGVLAALRGIERALKAPRSPEEGVVAQEPTPEATSPQTGTQRLTGGAVWLYELPSTERERLKGLLVEARDADEAAARQAVESSWEYNPRLVEKLLNPEGH
jgi:hypothetical protein